MTTNLSLFQPGFITSNLRAPNSSTRPCRALQVLKQRIRGLNCNASKVAPPKGKPVIYWMSRDQRVQDNWAMLYAQQCAAEAEAPVSESEIAWTLTPQRESHVLSFTYVNEYECLDLKPPTQTRNPKS